MSLLVHNLLRGAALRYSQSPALLSPGRKPMSYGQLWQHVQRITETLYRLGIGPGDRVAAALPEGPEMASAFLAISSAAVFAPLNPSYRPDEFEFYLSDLNPKALILKAGVDSPAIGVARSLGIPVIELVQQNDAEAGSFSLAGNPISQSSLPFARHADETSLILHTSGTTSRPRMVPLTQANLCNSARNIMISLQLRAEDKCLNVMPLFHIHGLIGALLSSITAGASVVCTPGFQAMRFFEWFEEFQPTWYTAVPTMHQAILARAVNSSDNHSRSRLRFIRSCSSPLPPKLMHELEERFRVPVVEAYGMTEAAHQMAINPLPPGRRKPGSVGLPTGCEIAVLDERGAPLQAGEIGAVAIRGPNVIQGYENNIEANASSFRGGWFYTGDQGKIDSDGYLFLTGRTKEIINRGGEKISPREIDEVLLDHPAVAQAMAFALPDDRLGEDVGAAVVLRKNLPSSGSVQLETELREFVSARLSSFKVPRHIVFLKEIPKGPTGKPQRIGMAAKLALTESSRATAADEYVAPQSELELQIVKIWEELLDVRPVGIRQDFFKLGGDSLLAVRMMAQLEAASGIRLPVSSLLPAATVENLASSMLKAQSEEFGSPIVAIQPWGSQPPLFFLHGQWRGGGLYCSDLSRRMGGDQPFFAVVPHGLDGGPVPRTIQDMAGARIRDLLGACPEGPLRLGGYCNGALVAFEMARQLQKLGRKVDLVVIVETHAPNVPFRKAWRLVRQISGVLSWDYNTQAEWFLRLKSFQIAWRQALANGSGAAGIFLLQKFRNVALALGKFVMSSSRPANVPEPGAANLNADPSAAIDCYVPGSYQGQVALLRTEDIGSRTANFCAPSDPAAGWASIVPQVKVYWVPGGHESIVREDVDALARQMVQCFEDAGSQPNEVASSPNGAAPEMRKLANTV